MDLQQRQAMMEQLREETLKINQILDSRKKVYSEISDLHQRLEETLENVSDANNQMSTLMEAVRRVHSDFQQMAQKVEQATSSPS